MLDRDTVCNRKRNLAHAWGPCFACGSPLLEDNLATEGNTPLQPIVEALDCDYRVYLQSMNLGFVL